jgi:ADP-ribose pyrophosphatase
MSATEGFAIVGSRLVCETPFLKLFEMDLETPSGEIGKRTVGTIGDAVAVVPVDGDDVVLIRQYRTPLDRALLELPAGKLDVPGEDPMEAAKRELAEEAGFRAGSMKWVAGVHMSPGFLDEHLTIYIATDLTPVTAKPMGPEEIAAEIVRIPVADIPGMLPEIEDAKTMIGLMALMLDGGNATSS